MQTTLERLLLFLGAFAALLLLLTAVDHIWPFAGTNQPWERRLIGLGFDLSNFVFAMSSYVLIKVGRALVGIVIVGIWCVATLGYAFWLLLFNPFSVWTVGIFSGLLVFCGFMTYLSLATARSLGLLRDGTANPSA